jgi:hypothetical protein
MTGKTDKEKEIERKARELIEDEKEETSRKKREREFEEQVSHFTDRRDASRSAHADENRLTALAMLYKFFVKKYGTPELADEEWEKLIESMRVLRLNRVFGGCPFPYDCKYYMGCVRKGCNADVCSNGYAYRYS